MNVNVKISISDENRAIIHENFYGGKKGLISRKDVNTICQTAITDWLMNRNNGPDQIGDKIADAMKESISENVKVGDMTEQQIADVMKQNELLLTRVNQLQHKLDTIKTR